MHSHVPTQHQTHNFCTYLFQKQSKRSIIRWLLTKYKPKGFIIRWLST